MTERPRYNYVCSGFSGTVHAVYDVVDNSQGAEIVLAHSVKLKPAQLIVAALNAYAETVRANDLTV